MTVLRRFWLIFSLLMASLGMQAQDASTLWEQAYDLSDAWKFAEARPIFLQVAELSEQEGYMANALKAKDMASTMLLRQGQFKEGIDELLPILEAAQKLPNDSPHLAITANHLAIAYMYTQQYEQAIQTYQTAIDAGIASKGQYSIEVCGYYINYGAVHAYQKDRSTAIEYNLKGLNILKEIGKDSHSFGINARTNLSNYYRAIGDYQAALRYMDELETLYLEKYPEGHPRRADFFNNKALLLADLQDLHQAIIYNQKALNIFSKNLPPYHPNIGSINTRLGDFHAQIGREEEAINYYRKGLKSYQLNEKPQHLSIGRIYAQMGTAFENMGQMDSATYFREKGLAVYTEHAGEFSKQAALIRYELARTNPQDRNQAAYFEQAIQTYRKNGTAEYKQLISMHRGLFNHQYLPNQQYEKAQNALNGLWKYVLKDSSFLVVEEMKYTRLKAQISDANSAIRLLEMQGDIWLAQEEETQALEAYEFALNVLDSLRLRLADISAQALNESYESLFEKSLIAAQNATPEKRFAIAEASKAFSLNRATQDQYAKAFAQLPDTILQAENKIKQNMSYFQQLLDENPEHPKRDQWENELFEQQQAHQSLKEELENKHPDYFQLKYQEKAMDLANFQQEILDEQTALLHFSWTDEALYLMLMQEGGIEWLETKSVEGLPEQIEDFRKVLTDQDFVMKKKEAAKQQFIRSGHALYEMLLEDALGKLDASIRRLVIVPDDALAYVPFELLLMDDDEANYKDLSYILQKYSVSYAYSADLLYRQYTQLKASAPKRFGGFASSYDDLQLTQSDSLLNSPLAMISRDGQLPLKGAAQEVQALAKLMEGEAITTTTEADFRTQASQFQLLHLAMHALPNEQFPLYSKFIFTPSEDSLYDDELTVSELYNLPLQAELAVLSACNTGYGKILAGEGVMSLSSAFAYAGCPSTVMSLWKIPDQETAQLMQGFYAHLQDGLRKDEALRQAKLDYLNQIEEPELAHPMFWGGFVASGNMEPLQKQGFPYWIWAFIIGGLLAGVAVLLKQKLSSE